MIYKSKCYIRRVSLAYLLNVHYQYLKWLFVFDFKVLHHENNRVDKFIADWLHASIDYGLNIELKSHLSNKYMINLRYNHIIQTR